MNYKMFTGQSTDIEKKINEWLNPGIEIHQVAQSSVNIQLADRTVPYTIISIFYDEHSLQATRTVE